MSKDVEWHEATTNMKTEAQIRLKDTLWGAAVLGFSVLSILVVAAISLFSVSPAASAVPAGITIVQVTLFVAMTFVGAFTIGRKWRLAPAFVALLAALPILGLIATQPSGIGLGIASFVFAIYYAANRWCRSNPPASAQHSPLEY